MKQVISLETAPTCRILNSFLVREVKRPKRDLQEMEQKVQLATDAFKRHFDVPSLPSNLVFDFEPFDDDNRVGAVKSIPLNSVLNPRSRGNLQETSALGAHGMGVDKTTALKRICSAESVTRLCSLIDKAQKQRTPKN